MTRRQLTFTTLVVLLAVPRLPAAAHQNGINGYSGKPPSPPNVCNACHSGGTLPTVAFAGPLTLGLAATGTYTFTVQSGAPTRQKSAGLDVASDGGTFTKGTGTQLLDGEVTHTAPKANNAEGTATWTFKWTAPNSAGNYTLWGAGNSVNGDGTFNGDKAAKTVFFVAVGGAPTVTPTFTASASPTRTPSRPAASATPTWSATPVGTATPTATLTATTSPTPATSPTDTPLPSMTATALPTSTPSPAATPVCVGDCGPPAGVSIDEVQRCVNIFLSIQSAAACAACDRDGNGGVTIDEVQAAVNSFLSDQALCARVLVP